MIQAARKGGLLTKIQDKKAKGKGERTGNLACNH